MKWLTTIYKNGKPDESATRVRIDQITLIHPIQEVRETRNGTCDITKLAFEITVQNKEKPLLCWSLWDDLNSQRSCTKTLYQEVIDACDDCVHPHEVDS